MNIEKKAVVEDFDEDTGLVLRPCETDSAEADKCYYPTQFYTLNLCTGKNIRDKNTNEIISRPRGIRSGGFILLSGRPSIGKSTFGYNTIGHIKKSVDDLAVANFMKCRSQVYIANTEDGMELQSMLKNLYLTEEHVNRGELVVMKPKDVYTESLANEIDKICAWKEENKKNLMFPQPCVGGGTKMEYIPTFLFVDSLSGLGPRELKNKKDNEVNNVYAMTRNKENGVMIINKFPKLREYNIITIWIVHVGQKVNVNGLPNQKDFQALSADYKVSDGKVPQFYADLFMFINKITDSDSKSKNVQDILGIEDRFIGNGVEALIPKNRWGDSSERTKFRLVMDYAVGWNPFYSLLYELKQRDLLKNAGAYKKLDGYPKNFKSEDIPMLMETDELFVECLKKAFEDEFEYVLEANNKAVERYTKFSSALRRILM